MLSFLNNKSSFINLNFFKFKKLNNNIFFKKKFLLKINFKEEIRETRKVSYFLWYKNGIFSILEYLNLKK